MTAVSTKMFEGERFLYRTVSRKLRSLVDEGLYAPGEQLPSANELAERFGVSTITIRRAIRDLTLEGHLVGRQGLGVFVANRQKITRQLLEGNGIATFEDDLRRAGLEPEFQELGVTVVSAENDWTFQVGGSGLGFRLDRLILAGGEPVVIDKIWLPKEIVDASNVREHFAKLMAQVRDSKYDHIDYHIEGTTATDQQAGLLKVVTGFPLLAIRFAVIGAKDELFFMGYTAARADRFEYEFRGRPTTSRPK